MPTTTNYNDQSWECYQGEDLRLVLTGISTAPDPSPFALLSTVARRPGSTPLDSTTSVTTGGTSGAYTLTVVYDRDQTSEWPKGLVALDVWRTDTGTNIRLAGGWINVLTPVRLPA